MKIILSKRTTGKYLAAFRVSDELHIKLKKVSEERKIHISEIVRSILEQTINDIEWE